MAADSTVPSKILYIGKSGKIPTDYIGFLMEAERCLDKLAAGKRVRVGRSQQLLLVYAAPLIVEIPLQASATELGLRLEIHLDEIKNETSTRQLLALAPLDISQLKEQIQALINLLPFDCTLASNELLPLQHTFDRSLNASIGFRCNEFTAIDLAGPHFSLAEHLLANVQPRTHLEQPDPEVNTTENNNTAKTITAAISEKLPTAPFNQLLASAKTFIAKKTQREVFGQPSTNAQRKILLQDISCEQQRLQAMLESLETLFHTWRLTHIADDPASHQQARQLEQRIRRCRQQLSLSSNKSTLNPSDLHERHQHLKFASQQTLLTSHEISTNPSNKAGVYEYIDAIENALAIFENGVSATEPGE